MPVSKKRKIVSTKRSAFWPCGSCRKNCTVASIECEACKRWHHMSCEGLTSDEFQFFEDSTASYTCNDCFSIELGTSPYSYLWALTRLRQWSTNYGVDGLKFAARREAKRLPPFCFYGKNPIPSEFVEIDHQAEDIMRRSNLSEVGVPGLSTGDGNCLFNSVSTVLTGDEDLAPELRLRTAVEMSLNPEQYKNRPDYNDLMSCSPSYEESMIAACTDGAYMSVWNIIALSTVVGNPIQSIYPALNGEKDQTPQFLNKLFKTEDNKNRETIKLLWSRLGPFRRPSWIPNHFVPILSRKSPQPTAIEPATEYLPVPTKIIKINTSTPKHDSGQRNTSTVVGKKVLNTPKSVTRIPQMVTIIPVTSPKHDTADLPTTTVMGSDGTPLKITEITNNLPREATTTKMELEQSSIMMNPPPENAPGNDDNDMTHVDINLADRRQPDESMQVSIQVSERMKTHCDSNLADRRQPDEWLQDSLPAESAENERTNMTLNDSKLADRRQPDDSMEDNLPVPATVKQLRQGRWHTAEELYSLIIHKTEVNSDVPPGDKSNCYLLVDNERNMNRISSRQNKKCDFYDDCGAWDHTKGNTCKTTYVVEDGILRHVEFKNDQYCTKVRRQKKVVWVPLDPQPADENIVTISRYYATHATDPRFEKKVSYFVRKTDKTLGNVAVYEYKGIQPRTTQPHGNAKSNEEYIRTNPKTFDKIQERIRNNDMPRDIYADLRQDDSLNAPRDFGVIRNKKYKDKQKTTQTLSTKVNIADEILEVIGMVNSHPYVQTIIHNKDQVPAIICYTPEQMTDLKHFLSHERQDPLGIDRTFNLGPFYVTTIVYKNQRIKRKESDKKTHEGDPESGESPIFMGPVLLHKEANYKVYKSFLEHVATEIDKEIDNVELRISEQMEFGSDDEKALTKAIEHVFPTSTRYLCTKHLKDNIKHYCQNKVGMPKPEREEIMNKLFGENGIVDADTTIEFGTKSEELDNVIGDKYPVFATYFENRLKPRLENYVFKPNRKREDKLWTNNNAESLNNILKLASNWRPNSTKCLIEKLHRVTQIHFMDYRSALHRDGNYRLRTSEKLYEVKPAIWRCKTDTEKQDLFLAFLADKKRKPKQKYISSKDGKLTVPDKAKGTAKKPNATKRPVNVRTKQRW